jgi:hypothetical protein
MKDMETVRLGAAGRKAADAESGEGQLCFEMLYAGDQFSENATQMPVTMMKRRRASSVLTGKRSFCTPNEKASAKLDGVGRGVLTTAGELGVGGEVAVGML